MTQELFEAFKRTMKFQQDVSRMCITYPEFREPLRELDKMVMSQYRDVQNTDDFELFYEAVDQYETARCKILSSVVETLG